MINYFENFTIPYCQAKVNNWEQKKLMLKQLYVRYKSNITNDYETQSNDYNKNNDYHPQVQSILMDDIINAGKFMNIKFTNVKLKDAWFQKYEQYEYHSTHNHGAVGFSSICYIEYDKDEHKPAVFLAPFYNDNSDMIEFVPRDIEEGSIVFFPSSILHYVEPNKSLKTRLVLSFNFSFK